MRATLLVVAMYFLLMIFAVPPLIYAYGIPEASKQLGGRVEVANVTFNPLQITLDLNGVVIGGSDPSPLLTAEHVTLNFGLLRSLLHRAVAFDRVEIVAPVLDLYPMEGGGSSLDAFLVGIKRSHPSSDIDASTSAPHIEVAFGHLESGRLAYRGNDNAATTKIDPINLDIQNFETVGNAPISFSVNAGMEGDAELKGQGQFRYDTHAAEITVQAHDLDLKALQSQFPDALSKVLIMGHLDFSGELTHQDSQMSGLKISHLAVALNDVEMRPRGDDRPILSFKRFSLDEALFDFSSHQISLGDLALEQPFILSEADDEGKPLWGKLLPDVEDNATSYPPSQTVTGDLWKIDIAHVSVSELTILPSETERVDNVHPGIAIGELQGQHLMMDLGAKHIEFSECALKDTQILLGLKSDEVIPLRGILPKKQTDLPIRQSQVDDASLWSFQFGKIAGSNIALGVMRLGGEHANPLKLENIDLDVTAFDSTVNAPTSINMHATVASGGQLSLEGQFNAVSEAFESHLNLERFGLTPLTPLLSEVVRLDRFEGYLSSQLSINGVIKSGEPVAHLQGDLQFNSLRLTQSPGDKKLLFVSELDVGGLDAVTDTQQLEVKEIRILKPDAVIAIRGDKSSNLSDLRVSNTSQVSQKPSGRKSLSDSPALPDVHIRRVLVEGGRLDYSDQSLVLPFATQIVDLKGTISGLTLDPSGKALLELDGRIAPYGEASIRGQLRPLDPKSALNVDLHFENVVLAALTPYSATFAGRRIEGGKLDLNASYALDDQQLSSQNKIFLKHLQLGEKVESPKAVSLPLDLAVALLTDSEGNIDLSLPIEGRTDAPDFDYGMIIFNALGNLIKNAVLSPFTAMAGVLGIKGGDDLSAIAFDLGRDELTPPEKEKVARLGEALALKPQLQIILKGVFDPEGDLAILRADWLRQKVADRVGESSRLDIRPDPVNSSDPKTQGVLDILGQEFNLIDLAVNRYVNETGKMPDRVGLVGNMFGKSSKTPDFYEGLVKLLEINAPVGKSELQALALRRIDVVRHALASAMKSGAPLQIRTGEMELVTSEDKHHLHMPLSLELN